MANAAWTGGLALWRVGGGSFGPNIANRCSVAAAASPAGRGQAGTPLERMGDLEAGWLEFPGFRARRISEPGVWGNAPGGPGAADRPHARLSVCSPLACPPSGRRWPEGWEHSRRWNPPRRERPVGPSHPPLDCGQGLAGRGFPLPTTPDPIGLRRAVDARGARDAAVARPSGPCQRVSSGSLPADG